METQLEVQLTADIKRLKAELKKAEDALKKLPKQVPELDKPFKKTKKSVANATPTLQEFSRVIQDAPYGIQGVANNIQQLTANFGNLSKSAGGTKQALKLMLSSLSGPTGILLAVSAITTLLVSFGDELFSSANKAEKLQKALDKLNEGFDAELSLNKAITENLELQGKSVNGILSARQDILRRQIDGIVLLIEEQRELLNVQKEANNTVTIWEALGQEITKVFNTGISLAKIALAFTAQGAMSLAEQLGIQIDLSKYEAASAKDKEKEAELQAKLNNLLAQKVGLENQILKTTQEQNKYKGLQLTIEGGLVGLGNLDFINPIQGELNKLAPKLASVPAKINEVITPVWQQLKNDIKNLTKQSLVNGISNTFNAFGQAIAKGENAIKAFANSLIGSFGQFLSDLGGMLIQYGILGKAKGKLDLALAAGGPAAIIAGGAAIAIGAALSAIGGALSTRASSGFDGVSGQGSSSYTGSNYSAQYETVTPENFLSNIDWEIKGTSIVAVTNRVNSLRNRNNSTLF